MNKWKYIRCVDDVRFEGWGVWGELGFNGVARRVDLALALVRTVRIYENQGC